MTGPKFSVLSKDIQMVFVDCQKIFCGTQIYEFIFNYFFHSMQVYLHRYAQKLFIAVACLHKHGYNHGDIKPSNILFNQVIQELHLCDFGYAQPHNTPIRSRPGTCAFRSLDNLIGNTLVSACMLCGFSYKLVLIITVLFVNKFFIFFHFAHFQLKMFIRWGAL